MKHMLAALCCLSLACLPALAQKEKKGAGAPMTDQQFVDFAAQTDMVEANLGQRAQDAGTTDAIKDYGKMLATDHTNDYKQLGDVAKQANLTLPDAIDAAHNKMIAPFYKDKGAAFDHAYVREMIAGHEKALAVYKKEAADAQNSALKSYAEQALTVLQKHLDGAKDLEKKPAEKKGKGTKS
jgi:putative membrane protein